VCEFVVRVNCLPPYLTNACQRAHLGLTTDRNSPPSSSSSADARLPRQGPNPAPSAPAAEWPRTCRVRLDEGSQNLRGVHAPPMHTFLSNVKLGSFYSVSNLASPFRHSTPHRGCRHRRQLQSNDVAPQRLVLVRGLFQHLVEPTSILRSCLASSTSAAGCAERCLSASKAMASTRSCSVQAPCAASIFESLAQWGARSLKAMALEW